MLFRSIGGDYGGGTASYLAINRAKELIFDAPNISMKALFANTKQQLIDTANIDPSLSRMGTTLTICMIEANTLRIGHSGDCRVYIVSKEGCRQITRDHTELQQLLDEGVFTKDELKNYHRKNVLTSALSPEGKMTIDEHTVGLQQEDFILMVSDGVSKAIELESVLTHKFKNPMQLCNELLSIVETTGPSDDFSAICIQI